MPRIKNLFILLIHLFLAFCLGSVLDWFELLSVGVSTSFYFVLLSLYYFDSQQKFKEAYLEDPELMEQVLREYFFRE